MFTSTNQVKKSTLSRGRVVAKNGNFNTIYQGYGIFKRKFKMYQDIHNMLKWFEVFYQQKIYFMLKINVKRHVLSVFVKFDNMTSQKVGIVGLLSLKVRKRRHLDQKVGKSKKSRACWSACLD